MSDVITIPRGELAAYQKAVERGKDEIAQLETERNQALADRDQALRAVASERAARVRSEQVVAAARLVASGPDSAAYTRLADALDNLDWALRGLELFPPPATDSGAEQAARQAIVGRLKRLGEDGRP